jgi:hypothetical protein
MIRSLLAFSLCTATPAFLSAQDATLFIPRNILRAYDKGTRSFDGAPGPKYWQNRATYRMSVGIEPKKRLLSGEASIVFFNQSPDTLRVLRFKLAADRYRKGSLRSEDVDPDDVGPGVNIERLLIDDQSVPEEQRTRRRTFLDVSLRGKPLLPGDSVRVFVRWSYRLPADKRATRECVCDPTTFFVPYWYPQIAVYDDLRGWASTPYSGQQEFYHDFADYDVTITLPKGFMAWATGEWQNPEELLQPTYLERFRRAHLSDTVVRIFTEEELKRGGVFKKAKQHVFRYRARQVPDFTFAASDHYNWDATSVVVDSTTGRRTFVSAAYLSSSKDFYRVARIAADGIRLMSFWLPGYPFPYPCMTVFNGNDGMEYPMMVNDVSVGSADPTNLTVHEVAHTYFPFMMGINEQEYAWMDEGWASFFDLFLTDSLTGRKGNLRGYGLSAGNDFDVPPMVRSSFLSSPDYGIASYSRPQAAYTVLLDLLGYDTFHRCMVEYMNRWKGKHPMPYDFFFTWNNASGQNLNWFWRPWFFEWGYPDLAVGQVFRSETEQRDVIAVERIGNLPIPVHLNITYSDKSTQALHFKADVWKDGRRVFEIPAEIGKTVERVDLGGRLIPDSNPTNNSWRKK